MADLTQRPTVSSLTQRPAPVKSTRVLYDSAQRRTSPVRFGEPDAASPVVPGPLCPVSEVMLGLGYSHVEIVETLAWLDQMGTPRGCPYVLPGDVFAVECAYHEGDGARYEGIEYDALHPSWTQCGAE